MVSDRVRVCVVGAGAAGLCAARHMLARPDLVAAVDVLEQAAQLGGTWHYTDTVGYDSFGLPVHTSMYKSLRSEHIVGVSAAGAGAAGLCAERHMLARPDLVAAVDVLEQAAQLGGTWHYTDTVGYDSFGLPVHTSMYKSLRSEHIVGVCAAGAGAAGLCAERHMLARPDLVAAVDVLEQAAQLGGTWHHTDTVGYDSFGLPVHTSMYKSLRSEHIVGVCAAGAGAAGLCAERHMLARPDLVAAVDVLEQAAQLGGTWHHTDTVGYDSFGLPVHTSMYKSLRSEHIVRVCAAGAGAAGLCAERHMLARPDLVAAVDVLEQAAQLGGTWHHTDTVGYDSLGLPVHTSMYKSLRSEHIVGVCAAGAGAAGLCAERHMLARPDLVAAVDVLEQAAQLGGTWHHTDTVGYDSFGLPVHTSMYKSLRSEHIVGVCAAGAGAAGLCAERHMLARPDLVAAVDVLEQAAQLGGTWHHTDTVGYDSFGLPVHTSMYKSLRSEHIVGVCAAGAGAAGLCAERHMLARPDLVAAVDVLEQAAQLGGTWHHTDTVGYDSFGLPVHTSMYKSLRSEHIVGVCAAGAGAAGLCAARHMLARPDLVAAVDVLEQAAQLGGTWHYTDTVGYDSFGLPVHTSMYKSLRSEHIVGECAAGAGAAGLCAERHMLARPHLVAAVDVLEQAAQLGGTWHYTDTVGYDSFGLPVHTSMYKSLRTNLPKEIMGFPDFPVPPRQESYLPAKDMLAFLQLYSDEHGVTPHIKFNHHVRLVKPKADGTWEVSCADLRSGEQSTREYDFVMVCNGHYNTPYIPRIEGMSTFEGDVMHSHDYRVPERFRGQAVLVIGAGPSGMDIALEITSVASRVVLSHHLAEKPKTVFPDNLVQRPDVSALRGRTAIFVDGSEEEVDVVFFCTGYLYNFPFLDPSCGVTVADNCVEPLYKHVVNIRHPTMCFIGVPFYVCAFSMFDLQVRYFLRSMDGSFRLPTQAQMTQHWEEEKRVRAERGYSRRQAHMMGPDQADYYVRLASESGAAPLSPVLTLVHNDSSQRFLDDLVHYRRDRYRIVDDQRFVYTRHE